MGRCCHCGGAGATLRAFDPDDGTLIWERALLFPARSTDGKIYGIAYEKVETSAARSYFVVNGLHNSFGSPQPCRGGTASTTPVWKMWLRAVDETTGLTVADSDFYWYQAGSTTNKHPPTVSAGPLGEMFATKSFQQDYFTVDADGQMLVMNRLNAANFGTLVVWDSNNTTFDRRYTLIAIPITDGAVTCTIVAEANGIHAELSATISGMRGITATDFATEIVTAFPDHVISCTATGGPWPLNHIDFEIEWEHDYYHMKNIKMAAAFLGRALHTRDFASGNISGWSLSIPSDSLAQHSSAGNWSFHTDNSVIGEGINPGLPVFHKIERWDYTLSGDGTREYTRTWMTEPTADRTTNVKPGGKGVNYYVPASRNGKLLVSHYPARGEGQGATEHCCWQELNPSTGAIIAQGTMNQRYTGRVSFANDSHIVSVGANDRLQNTDFASVGNELPGQYPGTWSHAMLDDTTLTTPIWNGSYGPNGIVSDLAKMYTATGTNPGVSDVPGSPIHINVSGVDQKIIGTINMFVGTEQARNNGALDPWSPLPYMYTFRHLWSPVNCRWNPDILTWRFSFGGTEQAPAAYTPWFAFDADFATVSAEVDLVLGSDDFGIPNARITENNLYPESAVDFLPQMLWQREPFIETKTNRNQDPDGNLGLSPDTVGRVIRVQVKTTVPGIFTLDQYDGYNPADLRKNTVTAMEWSTGDVSWSRPFGSWRTSQGTWFTQVPLRTANHLLVYGGEVKAELDPEVVVSFGTAP